METVFVKIYLVIILTIMIISLGILTFTILSDVYYGVIQPAIMKRKERNRWKT